MLLQVLIAATGNYGFFNVLSVVLCLSLLDDRDWRWLHSHLVRAWLSQAGMVDSQEHEYTRWSLPRRMITGLIGVLLLIATGGLVIETLSPAATIPGEVVVLQNALAPLRIANAYGLFAVMTTRRTEIMVEGSDDLLTWRPYLFRYKPCEPERPPRFAPFHLPRLDWQMWFAAPGRDCRSQRWFLRFEERLLEGSPEVLALLRENPFPDKPPKYVRARLFLYEFTRWGSGDWWRRTELGPYCPALSLRP